MNDDYNQGFNVPDDDYVQVTEPAFTEDAQPESDFTTPSQPQPKKRKTYGIGAIVLTAAITSVCCICIGIALLGGKLDIIKPTTEKHAISSGNKSKNTPPESTKQPSLSLAISSGSVTGSTDDTAMIAKCKPSIVSINVEVKSSSYFGDTVETGSGSGVIITKDGYIATCYHVIAGASKINVILQDGAIYEAQVVGYDSRTDIAVVKIDKTDLPAAVIGDSSSLAVGEKVYAIGNPLGEYASTVTDGIISGLDRIIEVDGIKMTLLQTNAAINPGNSGGGLFNATTGELIGIVNAKSYGLEIEGLGFAIPTSTAKTIMVDLMDKGYVTGRPYLGISMKMYSASSIPFLSMYGKSETYVKIMEVHPDSPAEKAGLKVGDLIVSFAGVAITDIDQIGEILNNFDAGDEEIMVVNRSGKDISVTIHLGEASNQR